MSGLENENMLTFVVMRHPFDRIVSSYYDKIIGPGGFGIFQKIKDIIKEKGNEQIYAKTPFNSDYFSGDGLQ